MNLRRLQGTRKIAESALICSVGDMSMRHMSVTQWWLERGGLKVVSKVVYVFLVFCFLILPVLFVCSFVQEVLKTVPQTSVPNAHNAKPPGFPLAFWTDKAYKFQCLRMFKARRFVVLRLMGFWGLSSWIFGSKVPSLLGGTWPIDLMGCLVFENYNIRKIGTHELVVRISQEFLIEDLNCNGLSPPI